MGPTSKGWTTWQGLIILAIAVAAVSADTEVVTQTEDDAAADKGNICAEGQEQAEDNLSCEMKTETKCLGFDPDANSIAFR